MIVQPWRLYAREPNVLAQKFIILFLLFIHEKLSIIKKNQINTIQQWMWGERNDDDGYEVAHVNFQLFVYFWIIPHQHIDNNKNTFFHPMSIFFYFYMAVIPHRRWMDQWKKKVNLCTYANNIDELASTRELARAYKIKNNRVDALQYMREERSKDEVLIKIFSCLVISWDGWKMLGFYKKKK